MIRNMHIFKEFLVVLGILFAGKFISEFFHLIIPGNVIGMILLFTLLMFGVIKVEQIEKITNFFLDNLAFFFLPAGVGILKYYGLLQGKIGVLILVICSSTIIVMGATGHLVQFIQRRKKYE